MAFRIDTEEEECSCEGKLSFADCFFKDSDARFTERPRIFIGGEEGEAFREGDRVYVVCGGKRYRIVGHWGYWNNGIVQIQPDFRLLEERT